jgi:hypothetical protein
VPYALGGAIAYGMYGPPRATDDVDVTVFVLLRTRWPPARRILRIAK